jgi:hypothetical protein
MVQSEADMTSLESIVLPLAESRSLVEHGIVLDTALYWFRFTRAEDRIIGDGYSVARSDGSYYVPVKKVCPAPVLSELLDAIRAKADAMEAKVDRGMKLERHEWDGKIDWEIVGQGKGNCEDDWMEAEGKGDTDLLAAAALLLEVSK